MALAIPFVQVVLSFVALVAAFLFFRKKKDPRLPPGPPQIPILGNLHQVGTTPQKKFVEWANQYGPIFYVEVAGQKTIFLSDPKIIKEVFSDTSSAARSPNPIFIAFSNGNHGVIMAEGAHWEQQRRFTLRKLRDSGFAKSTMEELILEEANSMVDYFDKRLDKSIPGNRIFNGAVVNALWKIMSGEKNEWDSPNPPKILKDTEGALSALGKMTARGMLFIPWIRHIAPDFTGWSGWVGYLAEINKDLEASAERHKKELDPNNPQDFIDHYLIEMKNETDPSSSFYGECGQRNFRAIVPDLFIAGSETTAHTLSWTMIFVGSHPEVQKKMHEELDRVVGQNRTVTLADRPNLPYTEAVTMEVLRRSTITTNGVPHRMFQDHMFGGYLFPKDTIIVPNLNAVHHDPKIWGDPQNFRPERFMSKDGTKMVKHEALMPFSVGKRQCIGMTLAYDTLFIFTANIFQKLSVKLDPSDYGVLQRTEPTTQILHEPEPFNIIVSRR